MAVAHRHHSVLLNRLGSLLAEDPLFQVPEFLGTFEVGRRSHVLRTLLTQGTYERALAECCIRWLDSSRDAIDVGAHVGFYSVLFAKLLSDRRVLAVEPVPANLRRFKRNLEINEVANRVLVFEGVAGSKIGGTRINVFEGIEEYSSVEPPWHPASKGAPTMSVRVPESTIDVLVDTFSLEPGFVKIDVEGYEDNVLDGARRTLREARPIVLLESAVGRTKQALASRIFVFELAREFEYHTIDAVSDEPISAKDLVSQVLLVPSERFQPLGNSRHGKYRKLRGHC